ncbi:MAG: butyrate kinase [Clostridia bacterium]|nr:butyrate kinase [Clostridia bacterium]
MNEKILVLNPGSTSTKFALFLEERALCSKTVRHEEGELAAFDRVTDQLSYRMDALRIALKEEGIVLSGLSAVAARGGLLPPVEAGAYRVNDAMVEFMLSGRGESHASNLGCLMADVIAKEQDIPAYIYDATSVDQLNEIARISGFPDLPRVSRGHMLNTRAMARKCAEEELHKPIEDCVFVVAHLGGGSSVWLIEGGRSVDFYTDDDGPMAPERSGAVQALSFVGKYFNENYTAKDLLKMIRGGSGIRAHLGTSDLVKIEERIEAGDEHAKLIYQAFAYQVAKCIGGLCAAASRVPDRIILTGGAAHSKMLTGWIRERAERFAPVSLMAGEYEMEALAAGALRVLRGEEDAKEFVLA